METKITINLSEDSFDLEIRGASLNQIKDLSTIKQAVADNLKANLIFCGADPELAEKGVNLLLQGTRGIRDILSDIF